MYGGFAYRTSSTPFNVLFRQYAELSLLLPHFILCKGNGILTVYPFEFVFSFDFPLGPDLPQSD